MDYKTIVSASSSVSGCPAISLALALAFKFALAVASSSSVGNSAILASMSALEIGVVPFNQIISSKLCPPTVTSAFGFIFLIAFVHLVHVLVALIALIVVFIKNLKGVYNDENYTGFDLASIFWHFVDILWIYLFIFLVFFG